MNLMTNERALLESDQKTLVLATHRVRMNSKSSGRSEVVSIMLDAVSSCRLARVANPFLLWIGIALCVVGILGMVFGMSAGNPNGGSIVLAFVGVIFMLIYFGTLKQVLEIASPSAVVRVDAKQMRMEEARRFIDALENARNERMKETTSY